jgi:hypothetical protein
VQRQFRLPENEVSREAYRLQSPSSKLIYFIVAKRFVKNKIIKRDIKIRISANLYTDPDNFALIFQEYSSLVVIVPVVLKIVCSKRDKHFHSGFRYSLTAERKPLLPNGLPCPMHYLEANKEAYAIGV